MQWKTVEMKMNKSQHSNGNGSKPEKNLGGRPTKFNPRRAKLIVDAISRGHYLSVACNAAGVDYGAFSRWLKKGKELMGRTNGDSEISAVDQEFKRFYLNVKRANAQAEMILGERVIEQGKKNGIVTMMYMSRRWPKRWRERRDSEFNASNRQTTIQIVLQDFSKPQIAQGKAVNIPLAQLPEHKGPEEIEPPESGGIV